MRQQFVWVNSSQLQRDSKKTSVDGVDFTIEVSPYDMHRKRRKTIIASEFDKIPEVHEFISQVASHYKKIIFTTKNRMGGRAGMGLSMVRDVINEHSGTIEIDPDFKSGCRFLINFPVQPH